MNRALRAKISLVLIQFTSFQMMNFLAPKASAMNLKIEDVNVEYVNGEFIDEDTFDISVNYINDTYNTLRCKAVVIETFPEDLRLSFGAYGYAFGNYRIPTGLSFDIPICDVRTKTILIVPFIKAIGGDLDKCVPDKGEYGNESFYPINLDMLPKVFPTNKYLLKVDISNSKLALLKMQFYIKI